MRTTPLIPRFFIALPLLLTGLFAWNAAAADAGDQAPRKSAVVKHYADIAHAVYADALGSALALQQVIEQFVQRPDAAGLAAARSAWKNARVYYQQSEVFRFGNDMVDRWEVQVNAWPLDEGFVDYVDPQHYDYVFGNPGATANLIAGKEIRLGTKNIDISTLTPQLLASLNELGGSEANVATGYHAIEFLLWGQDLNGTGYGAGARPFTDYRTGAGCTHPPCERRIAYLWAVTQLLIDDLHYMVAQWASQGPYREQLKNEPVDKVLKRMLFGMGSLSLGELAGERMKVALQANSPEDEHDCFSDNTHNAHYYSGLGIQNIYTGTYRRADGSLLQGPGLSQLAQQVDPQLDKKMQAALTRTEQALQAMVDAAEDPARPMPFDMMIAESNTRGKQLITTAMDALVAQTELIELLGRSLGLQTLNPAVAGAPH